MILSDSINQYLGAITPESPPVMREMEVYAAENHFPIIGPQVGRFLYQMASITKATRILELGSGFGYSAYWFSLVAGKAGEIVMTDGDPRNRDRALDYLGRAGLESDFDFRVGDALESIADLDGPFDIILNDIDKEGYPDTIEPAAVRLRTGGLFITDNLLWSGRVTDDSPDEATRGIVEFTRRLLRDDRFFTSILPVRDGISLAVRV